MCALLKADPSIAREDAIEGYVVNYTSKAQIEGIPRIETGRMSYVEADSLLAGIHSQRAMRHTSLTVKDRPYNSIEVDQYGITAVTAYLKAVELRPDDSLRNLCQMFSVLFSLRNSSLLTEDITRQIIAIPSPRLVGRLPQIMGHLNHPEEGIRNLVSSLLLGIGREYFQEVFFRLNVQNCDEQAASLLQILKTRHTRESSDAELFCDGMTRAAVTWFDSWKSTLENAHNCESRRDDLLNERFAEVKRPRCQMDEYFVHLFGDAISECEQLFRSGNFGRMWGLFGQLFEQIGEKIRQFSVMFLGKISEELAKRKGFAIFVPDGGQTLLDSVDPVLDVLPTEHRPRSCHLIATNGRRVKFLLKGNEDVRVDERLMQWFLLINTLLKSRYDLSIACYSILPLAPDAGLIQWVAGADTLQQIVADERQRRGRPKSPETSICEQFHEFESLDALQRLEVFEEVCREYKALELFEWIWRTSPNAATWVRHVERFTTSMASMSMAGYVLGLGDRHPGNVMIQKDSGSVVHVDLSDSLDAAVVRPRHAERVPFRLTRMIVNALEGSVTDGLFRRVCERVMEGLRKHRMTLGTQVVIFIGERAGMYTNHWCEPEHVLQARVVQKLAGTHLSEKGTQMSVKDHVELLIEIAEDPRNYVRHFPGWCPFW
jgi:hypothetical protein